MKKGKNLTTIKTDNRSLVLRLLCTGQCRSRVEIAQKTGLSKMTISNIVQDLIDSRYVYEGTQNAVSKPGRKPVFLHVNENDHLSIGIYVSRSQITASLISLRAEILCSASCRLSNIETENSLQRKILTCIRKISSRRGRESILGIGIAVVGPIDLRKGMILSPLDFFGIKNFGLREILEKNSRLPVTVNTDMNAAALAELWYGRGLIHDNFIYLGITHGIGSAIIIDGKLHTGGDGFAGEIGHMSIDHKGLLCSCGGRGCLEMYASMPIFLEKVRVRAGQCISLLTPVKDTLTFGDVIEAAKDGDLLALQMIDEMVEQVGTALIGSIHLLDTTRIVIGHESALGGDFLARKLQDFINQRCMFRDMLPVDVSISQFREKGSVVGSGILVFQPLFGKITPD